jgi:hypothetical protein
MWLDCTSTFIMSSWGKSTKIQIYVFASFLIILQEKESKTYKICMSVKPSLLNVNYSYLTSRTPCHPRFSIPTFNHTNMVAILIHELLYGCRAFKKTATFLTIFLSKTGHNKMVTTQNIYFLCPLLDKYWEVINMSNTKYRFLLSTSW